MHEIGDASVDVLALRLQPLEQGGSGAAVDDAGQELDDRPAGQPGGVQLLDQLDALDSAFGVVALAAGAALGTEQALLFVVAQGADADAGAGCEFSDTHVFSCVVFLSRLASDVGVRF